MSNPEIAAILAGLRLLQRHLTNGPSLPGDIQAILTDEGALVSLAPEDIDDLCEHINTGKREGRFDLLHA